MKKLHVLKAKPPSTHYSEVYTPRTRDIIARRYREDIERFGYRFERPS